MGGGAQAGVNLAWRLALRDLRGGLSGLRLLAVCLFLGVAALAAVGSLTASIVGELSARGQTILGGDLEMEVAQRLATPEELAAFRQAGIVSETVRMRAMATTADGSSSLLVELKGVDGNWPLYGTFRLQPGATAARPSGMQTAISPALAERFGIGPGDSIRVGEADLKVIGLIAEEPDRVGEGFTLGPVVLTDLKGVEATQLIQPGSLFAAKYRIRMPASVDPAETGLALQRRFPSAGWDTQDRSNGAPGTRRFIERLGQFLSLVGLTALIVAGIGVGNGVGSWLDGKRGGIATLKALGASSRTIVQVHAIQILLVAAVAIAVGLTVGALSPWAVATLAGDLLPVTPKLAIYPSALLTAAAFGLLTAFAFTVIPLSRARSVAAAALFRGGVEPPERPPARIIAVAGLFAAAIAALAISTAREPLFAAMFLGGAVAVLLVLWLLGWAVRRAAQAAPRPKRPLLRLALANLHRPGSQTTQLVVALGLGLTLFALLAVIESNFARQIASTVPEKAPSFFVLDIPSEEVDRFKTIVTDDAPDAEINTVPSLRGPIVAVRDQRVADMKTIPEGAWILRGDRGLTYARDLPRGNRIVAGAWWPADYAGPPLISLDVRAADALGLKVGDKMTVAVLGVEIEAEIASLREINWDSLGFNFALIFSPGALDGAPHNHMATVGVPGPVEAALSNRLAREFPSASLVRVKDVIGQVSGLMQQLAGAVRVASLVAVLAGIAVLIGAIAASRRTRVYDSVILKTLGGSRAQVLGAQALEYAALALLVGGIAFGIGALGGWLVVTQTLELDWGPSWPQVGATIVAGAAAVIALGLAGALPALSARPATVLREL